MTAVSPNSSPPPVSPPPADWLALLVWSEARNQIADGIAAVAKVALNRGALRFYSDGSIQGTMLARDQFSGFWFDRVPTLEADGPNKGKPVVIGGVRQTHYARVCFTAADALARARNMLTTARADVAWSKCQRISGEVLAGAYEGGSAYRKLTSRTVNYLNPHAVDHMPVWAAPSLLDGIVGAHQFYHAASA